MSPSLRPHVVTCPTCGKPAAWLEANRFRPFCCERCKLIDLGEWAMERNVIPGTHADPSTSSGQASCWTTPALRRMSKSRYDGAPG